MNRFKWQNFVAVIVFFSILIVLPFFSSFILKQFEGQPKQKTLPRIDIALNGTTLDEIGKQSKDVIYYDNLLSVDYGDKVDSFSRVQIKGHGNSSWIQPKKSYQIKFDDDYSFLGLPPTKKWILIANYLDESLLRNDAAFYVDRMLGSPYARQGEFADLYVDGEYSGLYYVTSKIRIDKTEIDLRDPNGILVELDYLHFNANDTQFYDKGVSLIASDIVSEDNYSEATSDFAASFAKLMTAAKNRDYASVTDLLDVESAARYYLLSEFTVDPDAYVTSFYMYKDGITDKIHFGPAWDFDYAFGNHNWLYGGPDKDFYSPDSTHIVEKYAPGRWQLSTIVYDLIKIPEFSDLTMKIFRETMSGKKEELLSYLNNRKEYITNSAHADEEKWDKDKYDEETEYLIDWVDKRFDHFERVYGTEILQPWNNTFML